MKYLLIFAALVFLPFGAFAQDSAGSIWLAPFPDANVPMTAEGEVLSSPMCFRVINTAPYTVTGSLYTNYYVDKERRKARHTSNFRLAKGESRPYCTYGPFYEGRKLELVLRTIMPIFNCKTMVDADIYIKGQVLDTGGTKSWAICLDTPQPGSIR